MSSMESKSTNDISATTDKDALAKQPWRAIWPAKSTEKHEHAVLYGYRKGTIMMTQGSAGEANMSVVYDTADHEKRKA